MLRHRPLPRLRQAACRLVRDRRGTSAMEYALLAALIAATLIIGFRAFGGSVAGLWSRVSAALGGAL